MLREQYRASYGCDCEGSRKGFGRIDPLLTDAYLEAVEDYTGTRALTCPWRAFDEPFVKRVLDAYEFYREGQLLAAVPRPSHKLMRGIAIYHRRLQAALSRVSELERDKQRAQYEANRR